jgi:membrane protease YdiL (CAAX protease family)
VRDLKVTMEGSAPLGAIKRPAATALGLLLAMFGTPLLLEVLRATDLRTFLFRECAVFLLLGVLLLLIRYGERLPFSSIGWHTDRLGNAALWGLLGLVSTYAAIALCLVLAHFMHWKVGEQAPPKFHPPLWAETIQMFRAGITEEAFRNGYALERLLSLTGSRTAALVITMLPFALFHFRQGPAGMVIAGAAGLVLSLIYLRRRSLPAVMLAHFGVDFIPNVLLPLFGANLG